MISLGLDLKRNKLSFCKKPLSHHYGRDHAGRMAKSSAQRNSSAGGMDVGKLQNLFTRSNGFIELRKACSCSSILNFLKSFSRNQFLQRSLLGRVRLVINPVIQEESLACGRAGFFISSTVLVSKKMLPALACGRTGMTCYCEAMIPPRRNS